MTTKARHRKDAQQFYRKSVALSLTEDVVKTLGHFQAIPFPTEMIKIRHESESKDSPVDRTRTLTVKNIIFNKTPASAFEMKWPEGAVISDRDKNIVYEIVHGKMIVASYSKNRPANEMLTGLMFLGSFTALGLIGVGLLVRRKRRRRLAAGV